MASELCPQDRGHSAAGAAQISAGIHLHPARPRVKAERKTVHLLITKPTVPSVPAEVSFAADDYFIMQ